MDAQIMHLFRGLYAIDLTDPKQLAYWAERFGVTDEQLKEASVNAASQSVNGLRLALAGLGYLRLDDQQLD